MIEIESTPRTSQEAKEAEMKSPVRLLVVEDEPMIVSIVRKNMGLISGFDTVYVGSYDEAEKAYDKAKKDNNPFQLLLVDQKLEHGHEKGGFEMGRKGKQDGVYVILFSASRFTQEEMDENGIGEYINKPFKPQYLMERLINARKTILEKTASRQI